MSRDRCARALLTGFASVFTFCATAVAQPVDVVIPSEDLKKALDDYIAQTGRELIYNADDVSGQKSHAVKGELAADQALERLLRDSGLVARYNESGAVVVFRPPPDSGQEAAKHTAPEEVPPIVVRQDQQHVETVTVTGSRVITNGSQAPTPVMAISMGELTQTTPSNVPDALNKLPMFVSSRTQRTIGGSTINWPANFLNLRDFGTNRTLILFDGMRMPATDLFNDVDTNTLPQALMERVDVVTGGASAVYGSDAITGVVNFVLDHHFNGIRLEAQGGLSSYDDDASYKFGIVGGTDLLDRGHFEFSFEHYNSDGIQNQFARPYGKLVPMELGSGSAADPYHLVKNIRDTDLTAGGYIASGPLASMTFLSNGMLAPFAHGVPGSGTLEIGGGGGFSGQSYLLFPGVNANPALVASLKTDQFFARFDYDFGNLRVFLMSTLSQSSNNNVSYVQNFTATFACDNAFLPADAKALLAAGGATSFTMSKALMNDTGAISDAFTQNYDVIVGAEGTLFGFDWAAHYTHGLTSWRESSPETLNLQRLYAAMDAVVDPSTGRVVCRATLTATGAAAYPGCVPFDAFGPSADNQIAFHYVTDNISFKQIFGMDDVGASVNGTIFQGWAGPVKAALDIEYRNVSMEVRNAYQPTQYVDCTFQNPVTCNPQSAVWNGTVANLPRVSEDVNEAAMELDIPLLSGIPFVELFDLNAAARYTEYSASGPATTWKLGGVWNVTDEFKLRAAISRDIRAPSLNDLFGTENANFSAWYDYVSGQVGQTTIFGPSNPTLKPEVSKTTTAGFIYQPHRLSGFTAIVDFYDIGINNAITYVVGGGQSVDDACASGATEYCGLAIRSSPGAFPTAIIVKNINVGKQTTHGMDAEFDYNVGLDQLWGSGGGAFNTRLLVSYQPSLLVTAGQPGSKQLNQAGAEGSNGTDSVAAERVTLNVNYSRGPFTVGVQERFHSAERPSNNPTLVYADPDVPAIFYTDLTLSYALDVNSGANTVDCFLTIENLFNQQPTMFIGIGRTGAPGYAYPAPFDEDVVGRYFTLGVRFRH